MLAIEAEYSPFTPEGPGLDQKMSLLSSRHSSGDLLLSYNKNDNKSVT
ncbi:hypothetical protein EDC54_101468 [Samsonia erythrinae]|uniref:Uncharacterized protein n=1 Tax=Samsonia erythrinae TaxID=160434 RepID=A0A4R3VU65_9GAMM|nr:hypothetical protein EDC54_101468 [Samsonia erythrinae]